MKEAVTVEHEASESTVTFTIPHLIVYGMGITYQRHPTDRSPMRAYWAVQPPSIVRFCPVM